MVLYGFWVVVRNKDGRLKKDDTACFKSRYVWLYYKKLLQKMIKMLAHQLSVITCDNVIENPKDVDFV